MAEKYRKRLDMAAHGCKLLEMTGIAENGWAWQKIAGKV